MMKILYCILLLMHRPPHLPKQLMKINIILYTSTDASSTPSSEAAQALRHPAPDCIPWERPTLRVWYVI
jgi:hypothetical protein